MKLIDWLLDFIYPPRCAFCGKILQDNVRGVCKTCKAKLPYVPKDGQAQKFKYIEKCVSPLYYSGAVRESLHRYKFSHTTAYADVYSKFIVKCIDENEISCDIITWVPLSRKRKRKRGYNQSELLGRLIAKSLGMDCAELLKKLRDNPPQSLTGNAEKRRANAAGTYVCRKKSLVDGKSVLLIDDIVTTGSTLSECAKMLKQAGAKEVICATVARSLG